MQYRITLVLIAVVVATGGCTSTGSTPATAPPTTQRVPTTTAAAPSTSTTTTLSSTTTIARIAEIQGIFQDLEQRRLEAIYTADTEAFLSLFADTPYRDRSLEVFEVVEPGPVPTITVEIIEVLRDDEECLALYYQARNSGTDDQSEPATAVLSLTTSGGYEYAFTNSGRGGWLCDGPHPLSG